VRHWQAKLDTKISEIDNVPTTGGKLQLAAEFWRQKSQSIIRVVSLAMRGCVLIHNFVCEFGESTPMGFLPVSKDGLEF